MPGGMSGRELADAVARLRPGVRVLYTSGYTEDAVLHQARLDESVLLLMKPYRTPQLARMVRQALNGAVQ
jgi:CheY-like chemotaxis protein